MGSLTLDQASRVEKKAFRALIVAHASQAFQDGSAKIRLEISAILPPFKLIYASLVPLKLPLQLDDLGRSLQLCIHASVHNINQVLHSSKQTSPPYIVKAAIILTQGRYAIDLVKYRPAWRQHCSRGRM